MIDTSENVVKAKAERKCTLRQWTIFCAPEAVYAQLMIVNMAYFVRQRN